MGLARQERLSKGLVGFLFIRLSHRCLMVLTRFEGVLMGSRKTLIGSEWGLGKLQARSKGF